MYWNDIITIIFQINSSMKRKRKLHRERICLGVMPIYPMYVDRTLAAILRFDGGIFVDSNAF